MNNSQYPYIDLPFHPIGWLGLGLGIFLIIYGIWQQRTTWRDNPKNRWLLFIFFTLIIPVTGSYLSVSVPIEGLMPQPGLPSETSIPIIVILAATPWVLGAGFLGTIYATFLGFLVGLWTALWQTHNIFTPIEVTLLAFVFSVIIRQRYRTLFFRILHHPVGTAIFLGVIFSPVYVLTTFFNTNGSLAVRLDYAITQTWPTMLARGVELFVAGCIGEILSLLMPRAWGKRGPLIPSPLETSLRTRFYLGILPFLVALIFVLTFIDWFNAGSVARQLIQDRLSGIAQVATENLPYFLNAGDSLITHLASTDLTSLPSQDVYTLLEDRIRVVPYFDQLYVLDERGILINSYPQRNLSEIKLSTAEQSSVELAMMGISPQNLISPPLRGTSSVRVAFFATIKSSNATPAGVIIGLTDLETNPFTQNVILGFQTISDIQGKGVLLDETGRIIYSSDPNLILTNYSGQLAQDSNFGEQLSPTGTRELVYHANMIGKPWTIIMTVPAEQAQEKALSIALPLLGWVALLSFAAFWILRNSLRRVVNQVGSLAAESTRISHGELEFPVKVQGNDEIGQLASTFEEMRLRLRARLTELNRLLIVSQGVAANLDAEDSIRPVLEAAIAEGGILARCILVSDVSLEFYPNKILSFGTGVAKDMYHYLDDQIFDLLHQQDMLIVPSTVRMRRLQVAANAPLPGALVAIALRNENRYFGAIWLAYDRMHNFTDEEIRFLSTLGGQATLAAANSRLYSSAEIGRQRLEAVLDSTPEPVLVIDEQQKLLLLNPAAIQIPSLIRTALPGTPIDQVVGPPEVLELINQSIPGRMLSQEILFSSGRIYFTTISPVVAGGRQVGKICILRDISHYKELDAIKSDFVATVSHDLRSPLTLMRGYSTMVQMVGELNEQQKGYIKKIIAGVDNMSQLVNNLLDLGRIDAGIGLRTEPVDLREIIGKIIANLNPQATQKNLRVSQDINSELPAHMDGDPALLQQAITNLVENAIKYTPMGGAVGVNVQMRQQNVVIDVNDTGIGIAPLDLPHLFEKFYRSGRREAYAQRGTGLGLAIVKSIVERHHGRVWVESQLGKGSHFYIEIPLKQPRETGNAV